MRKLILKCSLSPGDIVMLSAAVRDLHLTYPGEFLTDLRTSVHEIWENSPYVTALDENDPEVETIVCEYPLIHQSNTTPYHFIHGLRLFLSAALQRGIKPHYFKGDIHLSEDEKDWLPQVDEITGLSETRYWIIVSGGKTDFTAKWWDPDRAQQVVDHFRDDIFFVQCGSAEDGHIHPPLKNVLDLRGKTDFRQMIRLMYHAEGVICPVTMFMHLAAAVETKPGRSKNRPCVVVAGGREPAQWEAYPHHQYLHTNGSLPCCDNGGCWKSRVEPLGDGDEKDQSLCLLPVRTRTGRLLPKCLDMISADTVITAVEKFRSFDRAAEQICNDGPPVVRPSSSHTTYAFVVITDRNYFPGTVATLNSILHFHQNADIFVAESSHRPLTRLQRASLSGHSRIRFMPASEFAKPGRLTNAWELKAYAASDLCAEYDVIVGIDSDCVLCSPITEEIERCRNQGTFMGGIDGEGIDHDESYRVYGIEVPSKNRKYMSTSIYLAAVTDQNRKTLERWADCCNTAMFNRRGPYPGYSDQGVLNAILFAEDESARVELLDNRLWSQHWTHWESGIQHRDYKFVNCNANGQPQRSFHCAGPTKFWTQEYSEKVLGEKGKHTAQYAWFLAMLWFGPIRAVGANPYWYLPKSFEHLIEDTNTLLDDIFTVYPPARDKWTSMRSGLIR